MFSAFVRICVGAIGGTTGIPTNWRSGRAINVDPIDIDRPDEQMPDEWMRPAPPRV
jgi:hypothetical protein